METIYVIILSVFVLVLCVVVYLMYKRINNFIPKSNDFILKEQKTMQEYVTSETKGLLSWDNYNFLDIGCRMKCKQSNKTSRSLKGVLLTKENKPIIAFNRIERGWRPNGYMFASSSSFQVDYKIKDTAFEINWNGARLGYINSSGEIFDSAGEKVGYAKHPGKSQINIPHYSRQADEPFFDVTMNNRLLARIQVAQHNNYSNKQKENQSNDKITDQVVHLIDNQYTTEEEKWLTAFAILEVVYFGYCLI